MAAAKLMDRASPECLPNHWKSGCPVDSASLRRRMILTRPLALVVILAAACKSPLAAKSPAAESAASFSLDGSPLPSAARNLTPKTSPEEIEKSGICAPGTYGEMRGTSGWKTGCCQATYRLRFPAIACFLFDANTLYSVHLDGVHAESVRDLLSAEYAAFEATFGKADRPLRVDRLEHEVTSGEVLGMYSAVHVLWTFRGGDVVLGVRAGEGGSLFAAFRMREGENRRGK